MTNSFGQNSVLINLGSAACSNTRPGFFLIKDPLTSTPINLSGCDLSTQLPDYYNSFIAFNPKNSKIYLADIRTGATRIWVLDVGLPGIIGCPVTIPEKPDYTYPYVSNNFEFDGNGDLWSLSKYNDTTGTVNIDKLDVNTGEVINTRILKFPKNNFPTTITSGDICVLPNGRMFATLGISPSRLYEIKDYKGLDTARAIFLKKAPKNIFGIAYLNGNLEITGLDTSGCYYFKYDIATGNLSGKRSFQNGKAPIDNSSFSPALGATKQMVKTEKVNGNTYDIAYEIFVTNLGNTFLNDINITEDLGAVFGAANVSNISAAFVSGANKPALTLNPLFNGTSIPNLLAGNQQLPNKRSDNADYNFKINVSCRVTNIDANTIYNNSAIAKATINNIVDPIIITDSSNNGDETLVDPNNNGNANEPGENHPTPFSISLLPVKFLHINAVLTRKRTAIVSWSVATPVTNARYFEPEFSANGISWTSLSKISITDVNQPSYSYEHTGIPSGNIYYRVKQSDNDGSFIYSRIVLLNLSNDADNYRIYPNPAKGSVKINSDNYSNTIISLSDATGRKIGLVKMTSSTQIINTAGLPDGTYFLQFINDTENITRKLIIKH
jgi:hypothetical protein